MRIHSRTTALLCCSLAVAACSGRADQSGGGATPSTLSGTAGDPLPAGPLHTQGNQIVDAGGTPVRIASVGWNEIGAGPIAGIADNVVAIRAAGFNAVRVSWVNATRDADLARIDEVVAAAAANGVRVILDNHTNEPGHGPQDNWGAQQKNGLWYDLGGASDGTDGGGNAGSVTDARFVSDWQAVAAHYQGNPTVIGYDLRNEPLAYAGMSTWGDGNFATDLRGMYQRVGNAILAIDADKLIICEGPQNYSGTFKGGGAAPWGDLSAAGGAPVVLAVANRVVYSIHDYPREISGVDIDNGAQKVALMNAAWGYLVTQNIAPVWVGEMGSSMNADSDAAWADTLVSYLDGGQGAAGGPTFSGNQQGIGSDWWAWGDLQGQLPDGTQNDDGSLRADQQAVWSQLLYHRSTGAVHDTVRVAAGAGSDYTDAQGNVWSADSGASGGIAFENSPQIGISNTDSPQLYNGERYGSDGNGNAAGFQYAFDMDAGSYTVTLKFDEMYVTGAGQRRFDVVLNGTKVLSGFDIFAAAGGMNRAVDQSFPLTLSAPGRITIEFLPGSVQNPKIDAIAITRGSAPPPPPPPAQPPLIVPPVLGATPGTWQSGDLSAAGMTMHYNYLLPHGYSANNRYPVLLWLHENDMGNSFYDGGDPMGLAGYLNGWFNNSDFRRDYPCIIVAPYADQRSDTGGATSNFGGWTPPGDHGPNEDAAVAIAQYFAQHTSADRAKVYVSGASLGGIGSWAMMLDYNAINGPYGKVFAAGLPLAGVIERYGFGVDPPADVAARMKQVPVFAVHGSGDGESQPNWDRALWSDYGGGGALPGYPGAQAGNSAYRYLEDAGLGHDVWDTYYALPAGRPLYDWLFAQTAPAP